jgi:hypothetical protein
MPAAYDTWPAERNEDVSKISMLHVKAAQRRIIAKVLEVLGRGGTQSTELVCFVQRTKIQRLLGEAGAPL